MVKKLDKQRRISKDNIKADIIILGCNLPGIVTAHKLKKKFGDTMNIVVLDLATSTKVVSKCNVAFQNLDEVEEPDTKYIFSGTARQLIDNVARHYLAMYTNEFNIPLPDAIVAPDKVRSPLNKLFQFRNGNTVECTTDYHDFDYLCFLEKFELNQYQTLLDISMKDLFQSNKIDTNAERKKLLYYDQTTMEKHICSALIFPTCKEIMRTIVRLVCGADPDTVSVLFYLHQCYRTSSGRNHLDGHNTRFREKLLGYCRKRLANKLQQSVADITVPAKPIKEIRTYSKEQVILETKKGESNYVCNLLAMALRPDELHDIRVETQLLSEKEAAIAKSMIPGQAKRFIVQYEDNFWNRYGYSGDILSIRGPIVWAMERPKLSSTGSMERYAALIGYLVANNDKTDSKDAVLEQLVNLLGEEAATPVSYNESDIADVFIPCCGDYVDLRMLTGESSTKYLEWGALDVFAEGDVAAALEAGHTAYLNLVNCLRPQAQTFEDVSSAEWPTILCDSPYKKWLARLNYMRTARLLVYTTVVIIGVRLVHSYMRK